MFKRLKNKKGFTLVELLVTIAIIGILSTMVGLSVNFFIKQANEKTQFTTIETAVKTCNAIFMETNLGYSGISVGDITEYQSRIGSYVKEVNNVTGGTVNTSDVSADNNEMYIYYKYDGKYADGSNEPKYYLVNIIYKIDNNVWIYSYTNGKITLNGQAYN